MLFRSNFTNILKDLKKDDTGLEDLDEDAVGMSSQKQKVLKCLEFQKRRHYANSVEGKELVKLEQGIGGKDGKELQDYFMSIIKDSKISYRLRFFASDLERTMSGKKECFSLDEGIDDPVKPGILKNRLGKLSCTRVRSAKAKLEDKGTHYAKALQRYLNYHC